MTGPLRLGPNDYPRLPSMYAAIATTASTTRPEIFTGGLFPEPAPAPALLGTTPGF